jgi:cytidylate kinase
LALYAVTVYLTATPDERRARRLEESAYEVMLTASGEEIVPVVSAAHTDDLKAEKKLL